MRKTFKITQFAERVPVEYGIILFNRMLGGMILLSEDQLLLLDRNPKCFFGNRRGKLPENNIFIDDDVDEDIRLSELHEETLISATSCGSLQCLELSVSEHCNYQCIYCTFWRHKSNSRRGLMSEELATRALFDFAYITKGVEKPILYFGTGEPILNWRVIVEVGKKAFILHPNIQLNLITNGSLMTEEKLQFCQKYGISVGLSLDGLPETQKRQRLPASKNIDSSQAILDLLELGKRMGVNFSCLSGTYHKRGFLKDVSYLIDLCTRYHIPELDIDYDTGGLSENDNLDLIVGELIQGYKLARKADLNVFGYWMIPFLNILNGKGNLKSFCGNIVGKSVCITSDGNFKLCGYEPQSMSVYTNISDHLFSEPFRELCRNHLPGNNLLCKNCCLEGVCAGQCMLRDPNNPNWALTCEFYRKSTFGLLATTK